MPRLLDTFCKAGGTTRGYQMAGFEVVGCDIEPQPRYIGEHFIQANALDLLYALAHGDCWDDQDGHVWHLEDFDAIHASPPCQAYVQRNKNLGTKHPRLIGPTRDLLQQSGPPYVLENVEGAPLLSPVLLCGTMFGLRLRRHRLFEIPGLALLTRPCNHWGTVAAGDFAGVYAFGGKGHRHGQGVRDPKSKPGPSWDAAMGIDWMTSAELTQAIPPAYTEHIGKALLAYLAWRKVG